MWRAVRDVTAMNVDESEQRLAALSQVRGRASEVVQAVLSDDHNYESGVEEARAVAKATLAEFGAVGLAAVAVELSLQLAGLGVGTDRHPAADRRGRSRRRVVRGLTRRRLANDADSLLPLDSPGGPGDGAFVVRAAINDLGTPVVLVCDRRVRGTRVLLAVMVALR